MIKQEIQNSDYRIRKLIGILGLSLPIILPIAGKGVFSSMSHYYYSTLSSLLFIIILSSFALFLISYRGYKIDVTTEKVSDDLVTNIGGFAALIVVFVPTWCLESGNAAVADICNSGDYPLFGHIDKIKNTVHLVSAGIFIFSMGWMSKYKFTRSGSKKAKRFHRTCGNIVWLSIAILILLLLIENKIPESWIKSHYIFVFETTAVIPFGISWLVKGKFIEDIKSFRKPRATKI